MKRIAIFGTGLIGRGWAIIFARARHEAALYDPMPGAVDRALASIAASLGDLANAGLITESPADVMARVRVCASLAEALEGAVYAQESAPEDAEVKRQAFLDMDALAAPSTVLGSSCSAIPGSVFLEDVPGRGRCLIAHPANPPYLMPVVELIPTPWTEAEATEACRALMAWASERHGVSTFVLSIRPDNLPSQRLAEQLGFRQIGSHVDPIDGPEDILALHVGGAA